MTALHEALSRPLASAIARRVFPGAVLGVSIRGRGLIRCGLGAATYQDQAAPANPALIYDLASLTKVLVTTTLIALLIDEDRLKLTASIRELIPELAPILPDFSILDALAHRSGAPPCIELCAVAELEGDRRPRQRRPRQLALLQALRRLPEEAWRPRGQCQYSDVGFLILGLAIERHLDQSLDEAWREKVSGPLGLENIGFGPLAPAALVAPTERRPWGQELRGAVHDENAAFLGGVAGHAGLFSDLDAVLQLGRAWVEPGFLSSATRARFRQRLPSPEGSSRALGWDTNQGACGPVLGARFAADYFGHNGFTGTALWLHASGVVIALLSNRTWPHRPPSSVASAAINAARADVYASLASALPQLRDPSTGAAS